MINRELNTREKEILQMIKPSNFYDVVEAVRKDIEYSKYKAKKEMKHLHNKDTDHIEGFDNLVCKEKLLA